MRRVALFTGTVLLGLAVAGASIVTSLGTPAQARPSGQEDYAAQVLVGEWVYAEQCARCHGASGEGGEGPRLIGQRSLVGFRNAQRLYDFTSTSMPVETPGSLAEEEYWAVVAYLVEQNGYNPSQLLVDRVNALDIVFN